MGTAELEGVRIIALTQAAAGPIMGGMLADLGAEVIKIESNRKLDEGRTVPIYADGIPGPNRSLFNILNRGVKSCTIDLSQPRGSEILKGLVKLSGVVISNYSPRVLENLGMDYESLRAIRPDAILVSITGYGHGGPERDYLAYAMDADAIGGIAASFGYPGGDPALGLTYTGDVVAGWYGVVGAISALCYRNRTGKGQMVDVALTEGTATLTPEITMEYVMTGRLRPTMGNRDEVMAPHGCYPCRGEDKWVAIAVGTDEEWEALCGVMGNPEWSRDERYRDQYSRWQNQEELDRLTGEWTKDLDQYEVMHKLQAVGVAAGASLSIDELVVDPHIRARRSIIEQEHPEVGKTGVIRSPWAAAGPQAAAPLLGEHNDYVFKELLVMSDEEVARLVADRVIY